MHGFSCLEQPLWVGWGDVERLCGSLWWV
jgi:hypothetical protein